MKPILCLGDICADLILPLGAVQRAKRGERVPVSETDVVFRHGGSVANTAAALAKLGLNVLFSGTVGADAYGAELKEGLRSLGIDETRLRSDPAVPTLLIAIVLDEAGDRTAFATHRTGASQHRILPSQLPEPLTESIGWLHCSGMMLREEPAASTQLDAMRRCHAAGIPVSLDINARIESRNDAAFYRNLVEATSYCTVLLGSRETELPLLCGAEDDAAIRSLAAPDRIVVARDGERGATVYTTRETLHCPACSVPVADTIGAGDAYDAGFIAALLWGQTFSEANRIANAVAGCCVMHTGGRSTPTRKELDEFLSE
ncbi:MAG: carbohydrate kinase family protein [Clostridia bacterium]|nr:carbohydrate kinase family protein [Clostridia bacterium]